MSDGGVRFRLDPARPAGSEVRRVLAGLLDRAARSLRREPAPSVVEVGTAATALTQARALVRLARGGLDRDARRVVHRQLRAAQRVVGGPSTPLITDTFEWVAAFGADIVTTSALHRLRLALAEQAAQRAAARVRDTGGDPEVERGWRSVADELDAAVLAVSLWSLRHDGFAALAPGLERSYRRSQVALDDADADPDLGFDAIATLSARARDHHNQLELLRPIWPRVMKPLVRESGRLADLVDRQLALGAARAALLDLDDRQLRRDARALVGVLDEDRADLAERITVLGSRIFADEPAALVARFAIWWDSAS